MSKVKVTKSDWNRNGTRTINKSYTDSKGYTRTTHYKETLNPTPFSPNNVTKTGKSCKR